jgi:hypothetical protein
MNRRGFLGACLALGAAPAIVRADSLMRIVPRDLGVLIHRGNVALDDGFTFSLGDIITIGESNEQFVIVSNSVARGGVYRDWDAQSLQSDSRGRYSQIKFSRRSCP